MKGGSFASDAVVDLITKDSWERIDNHFTNETQKGGKTLKLKKGGNNTFISMLNNEYSSVYK